MIVDGVRIHFSKAYESGENRADNWGRLNFFLAGDGSHPAVAGFSLDTETYFWTTEATFQVVGIGVNTFLPIPIPGSRGCVGKYAVTHGSGRIFFVAPDGIYEQRGLSQRLLTGAITPFFRGETIDGQIGGNFDTTSDVRLQYHADSSGPYVRMVARNVAVDDIILKQHPETGEFTEVFFDNSSVTGIASMYVDEVANELLAGAENGNVYRLEDHTTDSDAGVAILPVIRSPSLDMGHPQRHKHVYQAVVAGDTNSVNLSIAALYDRNQIVEALGSGETSTPTGEIYVQTADATARRHDVALELTASTTERLTISRLGVHAALLPERVRAWDSDDLTFEEVQQLKLLLFDLHAEDNISVSIFIDNILAFTSLLIVQPHRLIYEHHVRAGLKGRVFRFQLTSADFFELYSAAARVKPLQAMRGYTTRPLVVA